MTLATHAVVGGSVAALFPSHPVIAFTAGFFSHFVLDAIPHWDYKLVSRFADPAVVKVLGKRKVDKSFITDLFHTGTDALFGVLIILAVWHPISTFQLEILSLGMIGGMLPDLLQFVYTRLPYQPMAFIQKFHDFMHAEYEIDNKKRLLGIFSQIIFGVCVILLVKYLVKF